MVVIFQASLPYIRGCGHALGVVVIIRRRSYALDVVVILRRRRNTSGVDVIHKT